MWKKYLHQSKQIYSISLAFGKIPESWQNSSLLKFSHIQQKKDWCFLSLFWLQNEISLWKLTILMIDTSARHFYINLNIKNIKTRYQYQYCRTQNSITNSIPIPKIVKFKLNLKTIPRYLDILRSQANTQKIRASIAHLWTDT